MARTARPFRSIRPLRPVPPKGGGWRRGPLVLAALLLSACGGGGGYGPSGSSPFIPDLENIWQDTRNASHTFSFTVAQRGQASSSFSGEEGLGTATNPLAGRYAERSIQFVIERAPAGAAGDVSYTGQFVDKDRIELTSNAGALTLCRALNGPCT